MEIGLKDRSVNWYQKLKTPFLSVQIQNPNLNLSSFFSLNNYVYHLQTSHWLTIISKANTEIMSVKFRLNDHQ